MAPKLIARQAELGEIDLAFHTAEEAPDGLRRRTLFKERYVLAGRRDHPRLRKRSSISQFCKLDHVIVSPDGGGFTGVTDQVLAQVGLSRRVMLSVPRFMFVNAVLANTDLVAMLPSRLVRDRHDLKVVESPVEVPGYELVMLWHER